MAPAAPEPAAALEESRLDASRPADEPLSPEEAAEMRLHLRWLRRHREVLRLKVNAQENLLLSGGREPTHRGQCLHLLGKVDLSAVQSALARLDDPKARAELLGGAVRFSSDVGILLLHLETLSGLSSRRDAAAAFGLAIRRVDFAQLSAARVRRVLELIGSTFQGHDRVQVLFGLLQSRDFRAAFDAASTEMPDPLAETFVPLRAVHEVVFEGRPDRFGAAALRQGVTTLLSAPADVLRSYPQPVRERLLEKAVRLVGDADVADRAEAALLTSLPREHRSFSRLGMLRAAELLAAGRDDEARALLDQVAQAHEGFHLPRRWLEALDHPRVGRIALERERSGRRRRRATASGLQRGFWLDGQRAVWVRSTEPDEAERLLGEVRLQRWLAIPGVSPVLVQGVDDRPHVAVPGIGTLLPDALAGRPLAPRAAVELALDGLRILNALALLGVVLPDAAPARFVTDLSGSAPLLLLADLDGAHQADTGEAVRAHRALADAWCRTLVGDPAAAEAPAGLAAALARGAPLPELAALLARAG